MAFHPIPITCIIALCIRIYISLGPLSFVEGLSSRHVNRVRTPPSPPSNVENSAITKRRVFRHNQQSSRTFNDRNVLRLTKPLQFHAERGGRKVTELQASRERDDLNNIQTLSRNKSASTNQKAILLGVLITSFSSIVALAKIDLLGSYPTQLVFRDMGMSLLSTALALVFVKTITALASKDIIQPRDSRKIIHSLSAPLYMLFWPLFSDEFGARLFAATVPLLQAIRLWLAATQKGGDDGSELAAAISRSGDTKEALGGPFIYVIVLFVAIMTCFKDNFAGMMALSAMAAGDGMADIFGRRFGKNNKWFFNRDKSMAGTAAFIVASSLCSIGLGYYFYIIGAVPLTMSFVQLATKFVTISVLSAFIELIPIVDDNWSVPICAGILSLIFLQ